MDIHAKGASGRKSSSAFDGTEAVDASRRFLASQPGSDPCAGFSVSSPVSGHEHCWYS